MPEEKRLPRALELSDLTLESAAFEVRYDLAMLHWDRAGALWSEVQKKYPSLEVAQATPAHTAFTVQERYELTVELLKAHIVAQAPLGNLDDFFGIADSFISILINQLEITDFKRVGFRHTYSREFASRKEATEAALSYTRVYRPDGPVFGIKDELVPVPEVALRWEGEALGATLRIFPQSRFMEFKPPAAFTKLSKQTSETHVLVLDLDQFTTVTVPVGQVRPSEWSRNALQAARRDCGKFMKG
jgi:hypothetical protein